MSKRKWFTLILIFCIICIIFIKLNEKISGFFYLQRNNLKNLKLNEFHQLLSNNERRALIQQIVKDSIKEILILNSSNLLKTNHTSVNETLKGKDFQKLFHARNDIIENTAERISKLDAFQIQTTIKEREMMYKLLDIFDQTMNKYNITYFLYGGTLLGSFRHHDIVPWDDDIDIILPFKYRDQLNITLKDLQTDYSLVKAYGHDKFFHKSGKRISSYTWLWPYLDISYYNENETHITDIVISYGKWYSYPKEIIFPLHKRPLLNYSLPAPKDTFAFLIWTYGYGSSCYMNGYSHMIESKGPVGTVGCETLAKKFPFVEHLSHTNGVREILKYNEMEITDIVLPEPNYAVSETFKLSLKPGFTMPQNIMPP